MYTFTWGDEDKKLSLLPLREYLQNGAIIGDVVVPCEDTLRNQIYRLPQDVAI